MPKRLFAALTLATPGEAGGASSLVLQNRVVMPAMARGRLAQGHVIAPEAAGYYSQRASAGLIISEGIAVAAAAQGVVPASGIRTIDQAHAWHQVTAAVRDAGGLIFAQLTHAGRLCAATGLEAGGGPVAPSALAESGRAWTPSGSRPWAQPRELSAGDIRKVIDDYVQTARNAMDSGFCGVEINAGDGGLVEQFLASSSNRRTDRYGGSAINRVRFARELLDALVATLGPARVGLKVAPGLHYFDTRDRDPRETVTELLGAIAVLPLAYLHGVQRGPGLGLHRLCRSLFRGSYIAGGGFTPDTAERLITTGDADAVAFGRAFIANPDLVARIRTGAPLTRGDRPTYVAPGVEGYLDYPAWAISA